MYLGSEDGPDVNCLTITITQPHYMQSNSEITESTHTIENSSYDNLLN